MIDFAKTEGWKLVDHEGYLRIIVTRRRSTKAEIIASCIEKAADGSTLHQIALILDGEAVKSMRARRFREFLTTWPR